MQIPLKPSPVLPDPENWTPNFHDFLAVCLQKDGSKVAKQYVNPFLFYFCIIFVMHLK